MPGFQPGEAGSIPAGHSRGSANGRLPGFEPGDAGSSPAPRTLVIDAGSSNGRTGRSERSGVGSIPAPATYKRKSSGRMRSLSRKQVRSLRCGFESHGFRSNIVPWSSGNDSWPTPRQRRFKSVRDYLRSDTPTGRAARLKPERLQVRLLLRAHKTHGSVGNWQTTLA